MKHIVLAASLTLLLSSIALAAAPESCPSADEIKSVGLSHLIVKDSNGKWHTGRTGQYYNTPQQWTFIMGYIDANSSDEALKLANTALTSLTYFMGPKETDPGKYLCTYVNNSNYMSIAITPPIDIPPMD